MSSYPIEIVYGAGWSASARAALDSAANLWLGVITAPLPAVTTLAGRVTAGLILTADIVDEAAGGGYARAGPLELRPSSAGAAAYLPATGELFLDVQDVQMLESSGRLARVLAHEIGHVLGIGTIWTRKGLIQAAGTSHPQFVGSRAMAEYGALRGGSPLPVPVENSGGAQAADKHWREAVFGEELMSTYLSTSRNPLSRITIASLQDLGYSVSYGTAESYSPPALMGHVLSLFNLFTPSAPAYRVRGTDPVMLPDDALTD